MKPIRYSIFFFLLMSVIAASCSSSKKVSKASWIDNPSSVYPEQRYITAVGSGFSAEEARRNALSNLSRIFKTDIQSQAVISSEYTDYLNKKSEGSETYTNTTTLSSDLQLLNAKVLAQQSDNNGQYHAIAGILRSEGEMIYEAEINDIQEDVDVLIAQAAVEESPIRKLVILSQAKEKDGIAQSFVSQLRIISPSSMMMSEKKAADNKLENAYAEASKDATFCIVEASDKNCPPIIYKEIQRIYEEQGFRFIENGTDENCILKVVPSLDYSRTLTNRQDVFFYRWDIHLQNIDTQNNSSLKTFSFSERTGSDTQANAYDRMLYDVKKSLKKALPEFINNSLLK